MMKKKWVSPELQVLTRSKPEEVVLAGCKTSLDPHPIGPNLNFGNCTYSCGSPCSDIYSS